MNKIHDKKIAVLIPCYNEEVALKIVISNFKIALPCSKIYVYDNNSTDSTVQVAKDAGAIVRSEPLQGKGNVVRRMFADVEADIYVLVDSAVQIFTGLKVINKRDNQMGGLIFED